MNEKGTFTVGKNVLIPQDDRAHDILAKLKVGERVLTNVHKPRYIEHHRLAFAVLQKVAEAKGESVDTVLTWLKVCTGRVDFVQMPNGKVVTAPKSINFASMDQAEFSEFWKEAIQLICDHILPGCDEHTFDEIREMIA